MAALNINRLYDALKPLIYLERRKQKGCLPPRTLVLANDDRPGRRGIVLIEDPVRVRSRIERDKPHR